MSRETISPPPRAEHVERVEVLISNLLRLGVMSSLAIIVLGTVLSFSHHPTYVRNPEDLMRLTKPGTAFPHSTRQVLEGVLELRGQAIVVVGLLVLIATPVLRVGVSILAFAVQRDRVFVAVTSVVFVLLLLSFILGKVEG